MTKPEKPYRYEVGTNPVMMTGKVRPVGRKVLLRALLSTDSRDDERRATGAGLIIPAYNTEDAACFEVIAVGGGVKRWCDEWNGGEMIEVGQHVEMRSSAADRVHAKEVIGRFWMVDCEDVGGQWPEMDLADPVFQAALTEWLAIKEHAVVIPKANTNGEAVLEAAR